MHSTILVTAVLSVLSVSASPLYGFGYPRGNTFQDQRTPSNFKGFSYGAPFSRTSSFYGTPASSGPSGNAPSAKAPSFKVPTDNKVTSSSKDRDADAFVSAHNSARAQYGARPLTWSAQLASGTFQYASQCKFQHSNSGGQYGENLYASGGLDEPATAAVPAWMSEASKYNYARPGFSLATGHFTQVVWKSTTQVACARVPCPAGSIFPGPSVYTVCRYSPPGNYEGEYVQNVGRRV